MVYLFCKLMKLIPGKSRSKGRFLSAGLWVVAISLLFGGLILARDHDPFVAPILVLIGAHILFWLGTINGTSLTIQHRFR